MNNNYFKIPKLQLDGKLLPDDALAIYKHYLSQEKKDFNQDVRRPCRSAILKAMVLTHDQQSGDASQLINDHINKDGNILFWSDQHFYHNNIIKYSSRPFDSMEHMNKEMVSNYFKSVTDDDLVIFGGDISFGELDKTKVLLRNLPGKKVLIIGNHDFDKNKYIFRDYKIFDAVAMSAVFYKKVENKVMNVILTHYPIDNKWLPENTINVHGHTHQYQADVKNINISVEHMEYKPQNIDKKIEVVFLENYA